MISMHLFWPMQSLQQRLNISSTPQLPFKTPQIPSTGEHKELDRGTWRVYRYKGLFENNCQVFWARTLSYSVQLVFIGAASVSGVPGLKLDQVCVGLLLHMLKVQLPIVYGPLAASEVRGRRLSSCRLPDGS